MILQNGKRIDGCSDTVPVGTLQSYLGLVPPKGYLVCQGQLVSKITYSKLYEICGDAFGVSTDTHFYLPDLRGKTLAGYDENDSAMNTIGKLLGQKGHVHTTGNHTLTTDEMPTHYHDIVGSFNSNAGLNLASSNNGDGTSGYMTYSPVHPAGGSQPHNHGNTGESTNYQPTITVNWIVKAVMLIPDYIVVEDTLNSDSAVDALSARQGRILNEKFVDYATKSEMIQYLPLSAVTNSLTSTSATSALSAAQGKILNDTKQNVLEHGRVHASSFTEYTFGTSTPYCYYEYYFQQTYADIPVVVCSTSNTLSRHFYGNISAHVCEITKQKCVFILPVSKLDIYFNFVVLPV